MSQRIHGIGPTAASHFAICCHSHTIRSSTVAPLGSWIVMISFDPAARQSPPSPGSSPRAAILNVRSWDSMAVPSGSTTSTDPVRAGVQDRPGTGWP